MTQAIGSNVNIKVALETQEGKTPTSGNYVNLSFKSGEGLTVSRATYTSEQISKHRGVLDIKSGSFTVGGSLPTELSYDNFCLFAYAALGNVEESGQVKTFKRAKKIPTFTFEKSFTDINDHYVFNGIKFDNIQLQTQLNGLVSVSTELKGLKSDHAATSFLSALTSKDLTSDLISDLETKIKIGDLEVCASSLNLSINNDLTESRCIGSAFAKTQAEGKGGVTGDVSFAFENSSVYEKWKNETVEKMEITYKKDENTYIKITLPKVKWGGDGIAKVDSAEALFLNMSFTALIENDSESDIIIEIKSPLEFKQLLGIA
jgi:hypothetical protein|nr:MAG TPA: Tail tube protein [Caudoviricetes sp.]